MIWRSYREMRSHGLHAQAAIHVAFDEFADPTGIYGGGTGTQVTLPEGQNSDQALFLVRSHDGASGKAGNAFQG